jgi:hypothetical protein
MKKILLVLVIAFFATEFSYGQFALGLRLGYSASKLTTNVDSIKSDFNNGFHFGAWARFGKRLYLSPEFLYNMSGSVFTSEGNLNTSDWKQKVKVGSIDIPVLVGFKIIHSDLITWRIELGPEMSLATNKKVEDMEGLTGGPITTDDISSANWYVLAGTGIDVLFLRFDIRYQYGLNEMISDVQNSSLSSKNSLLLVSVGFKIFGHK